MLDMIVEVLAVSRADSRRFSCLGDKEGNASALIAAGDPVVSSGVILRRRRGRVLGVVEADLGVEPVEERAANVADR